jgi:hypothetical protein
MKRLLLAGCWLVIGSGFASAQAPPAAWKPFQEMEFLVGSWSGATEGVPGTGGRFERWQWEFGRSFLVVKATTIFPGRDGKPEERHEEIGYYSYDRDRRRYTAVYFLSEGIRGLSDVEILGDGSLRLTSTALENYEPGAKTRRTIQKKSPTEIVHTLEIQLPGRDWVVYFTDKLEKK